LTTDKWQRIFTLYRQIRTLPNNENITKAKNMFTKDKTLAMYAYVNNVAQYVPLIKEGLNWDMVSYPTFKEAPGKGLEFNSHDMMISSTSKFPDAAFLAITALTGDEAQMQVSEKAMIPAAKDEKIKKAFATSFPELKQHNINVQALFKVTPVILPPATEAITAVKAQVDNAMNSVLAGSDINTALRTAEEAANQAIAALGNR
jgi:multiple sugar transport system substrate-binding protein